MITRKNEIGKTRIFCLAILLLAGAFLPLTLLTENAGAQHFQHNPIEIITDAGFASPSSGVTQGTGTEYYPFIIENWEIAAPLVVEGIRIQDTMAYVIIRNCLTYTDVINGHHAGIHIINAEHVTIENCEVRDTRRGIMIESSDVTLKNNVLHDNDYGISIDYESRESIPKMEGNLVNEINIDGTINKEEQCYFYDEDELVIDGKVEECVPEGYTEGYPGGLTFEGLITLYDCENFLIKNCNLSNNANGIYLGNSNGTITDSSIFNNTWGLGIECYSSSPLIIKNNISYNGWGGIYCDPSSSPYIKDNNIYRNKSPHASVSYGVFMPESCPNPIIENNTIIAHGTGLWIDRESSADVRNNFISGNGNGVFFQRDSTGVVENNTIDSNSKGIWSGAGSFPLIINNQITSNSRGIHCPNAGTAGSGIATIVNNNISENREEGIFCFYQSSPEIRGNILSKNNISVFCKRNSNPEITNNIISENVRGVMIEGRNEGDDHRPSRPVIHENNFIGNTEYAVYNEHEGENANLDENGDQVVIDAENNWWNAINGPSGAGGGDGDNVSEYVDHDPWLSEAVDLNYPPSVEIIEPGEHEEVSGVFDIMGTASDPNGDNELVKVEIRIDDGDWEEAEGTSDWSYQWDTTGAEDGNHTIYAKAFDGEDYSYIAEVDVNVNNEGPENHLPTIEITDPEDGSTVDGTITIQGTAEDEDGDEQIEKVEIKIDDGGWGEAKIEEADGTISWSFQWDTMETEDGKHTVYARAYDGEDYSQISEVDVTVDNEEQEENHEPEIEVTSVEKTDDYTIGIRWTASDQDGDTLTIDLYYDADLNPDNGRTPIIEGLDDTGSYDWDISGMEDADYYILAVARDPGGKEGSDYSEKVTISLPELAPDFAIVSFELTPPVPEAGDTVVIRAVIRNEGTASGTGTVEFLLDGLQLEAKSFTLRQGKEETMAHIWSAIEGNHSVSVHVSVSGDSDPSNNEQERVIGVAGAPGGKEKDSDDEFAVMYLGLTLAVVVVVGGVGRIVVYRKKEEATYLVRCPECGSEIQYSEEENDHYCWECEEYITEMDHEEEAVE